MVWAEELAPRKGWNGESEDVEKWEAFLEVYNEALFRERL